MEDGHNRLNKEVGTQGADFRYERTRSPTLFSPNSQRCARDNTRKLMDGSKLISLLPYWQDGQVPPPFCHICSIVSKFDNGSSQHGTGWLIGRRTVVTAGHCLKLHGERARSVSVTRAQEGRLMPYAPVMGTRCFLSAKWEQQEDPQHDYGAIVLAADFSATENYCDFKALPDAQLANRQATIAGYPYAPLDALHDYDGTHQYGARRIIEQVTPDLLRYDISTLGGQSGSPIWIFVNNRPCVVGIHTYGDKSNYGTRITGAVEADLREWQKY